MYLDHSYQSCDKFSSPKWSVPVQRKYLRWNFLKDWILCIFTSLYCLHYNRTHLGFMLGKAVLDGLLLLGLEVKWSPSNPSTPTIEFESYWLQSFLNVPKTKAKEKEG